MPGIYAVGEVHWNRLIPQAWKLSSQWIPATGLFRSARAGLWLALKMRRCPWNKR